MNSSFDDQASQSNTDQQSEASSANPPSPRSTSTYNIANSFLSSQQLQPTNGIHHLYPESYLISSLSGSSSNQTNTTTTNNNNNSQSEMRKLNQTQRFFHLPTHTITSQCSGVDKLIMAAMLEDSTNAASIASASRASNLIPIGRGIGHFPNSMIQDNYQQIPTPSNKSELELYRLLERANLLNYFGTFLNFGGDDVQQLSDADEEEFLEIMSFVGMTQKPLHVRRLQKALIEWRENRENQSNSNFKRPHEVEHTRFFQQHHHQANYDTSTDDDQQSVDIESSSEPVQTLPTNLSTSSSNCDLPQYILPHELFINAPKRLRLMDDLHRRRQSDV